MKIKLNNVRLSFPNLFKPVAFEPGAPERYDATYLVEPGSENDKAIRAAIKSVATEKFGKKAEAILGSIKGNTNKFCYLDGNLKEYDGYEGMYYLACHRKAKDGPPYVCDENRNQLSENAGKPYAGCYVNATVDIYAQGDQYTGIRAGIVGVQFAGDGDAFGGTSKGSADDFDDLGNQGSSGGASLIDDDDIPF